jgi:hypothetical protein
MFHQQIKGTDEEWKTALETKRLSSVKNFVSVKTGEKRIRSEAGDQEAAEAEREFSEKKKKKLKSKH